MEQAEGERDDEMYISAKCSVAIHCLIFIAEYGAENKVTSEMLSLSTGSNPVTIRGILSALKKAGILSVKSGTGGAELCCPPGGITLCRVCKAVEPKFAAKLMGVHTAPSPFCPVGRNIRPVLDITYQKISQSLCESLQGITLEEILADYHRRLEEENGRSAGK